MGKLQLDGNDTRRNKEVIPGGGGNLSRGRGLGMWAGGQRVFIAREERESPGHDGRCCPLCIV